ncbi:MAG: hypothetical protein ACYTG6_16855, partial [Planctomycetota bacterium]
MKAIHSLQNDATERGHILIPIVLLVLLIGGLSAGMIFESQGNLVSVTHQETSLAALEVAEMGLVQAELEIRGLTDSGTDGIGNVTGDFGHGRYVVTAQRDPDTENRWVLTATGTHGLSVRRIEIGIRRRGAKPFVESLYSKETLDFGGSSATDAYDSRNGTYASQAVNSDAGGSYAEGGGHIGSGMDIILHGSSSVVRGDAVPGSLFSTQMNGTPIVWGDTYPRRRDVDLPAPGYADFLDAFNNNANHTLTASTGGADAPVDLATISDASLAGLTDGQVDQLQAANLLLMDDTTLTSLTYADILGTSYTSLLNATLEDLSKEVETSDEYYKLTYESGIL